VARRVFLDLIENGRHAPDIEQAALATFGDGGFFVPGVASWPTGPLRIRAGRRDSGCVSCGTGTPSMTTLRPEFAEDARKCAGDSGRREAGGRIFAKLKPKAQGCGAGCQFVERSGGFSRRRNVRKTPSTNESENCDKSKHPVLLFWSGTTSERMAEILMCECPMSAGSSPWMSHAIPKGALC